MPSFSRSPNEVSHILLVRSRHSSLAQPPLSHLTMLGIVIPGIVSKVRGKFLVCKLIVGKTRYHLMHFLDR